MPVHDNENGQNLEPTPCFRTLLYCSAPFDDVIPPLNCQVLINQDLKLYFTLLEETPCRRVFQNTSSASNENPQSLWNLKVHYRLHKSPTLVHILTGAWQFKVQTSCPFSAAQVVLKTMSKYEILCGISYDTGSLRWSARSPSITQAGGPPLIGCQWLLGAFPSSRKAPLCFTSVRPSVRMH
jgi:hypothetical protein